MKTEIKKNVILWGVLVALICLSTLFAENGMKSAYVFIPLLSIVKFTSVLFQFVEVKHAHLIWKMIGVLFVLIYFIGILVLY